MLRIAGAASVAILSLGALSACGDDGGTSGSGGYCDDVRSAAESFLGLDDAAISQETFDGLLGALHTISDEAPSDVKDDWATFSAAADSFNAALDKAGMSMDDVQGMHHGPSSGPQMQAVMQAAASLGSIKVANARAAISKQANSECDVDLSGS